MDQEVGQIGGVNEDAGEGGGIGRQLNFLQKLFNFLALDPHPFPDVIYWAADSKQLVIARPDELAKNVLPKLFKHDKVSSFGRQLNIYGFARVYPGRQFKDDQGNILDASVWAHPTLHRLSSHIEVSSVRRRAAPKLFRTRRLASGEKVRVKAGPDVARKFREIKEDMALEKRIKHGWIAEPSHLAPDISGQATPLSLFSGMEVDDSRQDETMDDSSNFLDWDMGSAADRAGHVGHAVSDDTAEQPTDESMSEQYEEIPASLEFYKPAPLYFQQSLSSIPEGGHMSADKIVTPQGYVDFPLSRPYLNQEPHHTYYPSPLDNGSFSGRHHRSCPASIHTSPVLSPSFLPPSSVMQSIPRHFPPSFVNQPMVMNVRDGQQHGALQLRVNTHVPMRIAAPAAINPFPASYTSSQDMQRTSRYPVSPFSPDSQLVGNVPSSFSAPVNNAPRKVSAETTPSDGMSREGSVYPEGQSWERTGIIDPRWVSPRGSTWNTPVATPRCGSPVAQAFPESQLPRGWPVVGPSVSPVIYGEEGGGMPWGQKEGEMGPPPIPQG